MILLIVLLLALLLFAGLGFAAHGLWIGAIVLLVALVAAAVTGRR